MKSSSCPRLTVVRFSSVLIQWGSVLPYRRHCCLSLSARHNCISIKGHEAEWEQECWVTVDRRACSMMAGSTGCVQKYLQIPQETAFTPKAALSFVFDPVMALVRPRIWDQENWISQHCCCGGGFLTFPSWVDGSNWKCYRFILMALTWVGPVVGSLLPPCFCGCQTEEKPEKLFF